MTSTTELTSSPLAERSRCVEQQLLLLTETITVYSVYFSLVAIRYVNVIVLCIIRFCFLVVIATMCLVNKDVYIWHC